MRQGQRLARQLFLTVTLFCFHLFPGLPGAEASETQRLGWSHFYIEYDAYGAEHVSSYLDDERISVHTFYHRLRATEDVLTVSGTVYVSGYLQYTEFGAESDIISELDYLWWDGDRQPAGTYPFSFRYDHGLAPGQGEDYQIFVSADYNSDDVYGRPLPGSAYPFNFILTVKITLAGPREETADVPPPPPDGFESADGRDGIFGEVGVPAVQSPETPHASGPGSDTPQTVLPDAQGIPSAAEGAPADQTGRGIILSPGSMVLQAGSQRQISCTVSGHAEGEIRWISSNPKIASVTGGVVTAHHPGAVKIMAVIDGSDLRATSAVMVTEADSGFQGQ